MIGAAVIAALTFVLSNYAIPPTNVKRIAYTNKYVKNARRHHRHRHPDDGGSRNCRLYRTLREFQQDGVPLSMDKFNGKQLVSRLTAQTVTYDSTRQYHWMLHDYMIRDFNGMTEENNKRKLKRHGYTNRAT